MRCEINPKTMRCVRCKSLFSSVDTFANCQSDSRPGLGDIVAAGLSAIGITKERVSRVVGGDCGCAQRQEALNDIARKIGIG